MFFLVIVYNSLFNSKKCPQHISSVSLAMVYFLCISTFAFSSGGCLNLVSLLGPSVLSKNFNDWSFYILSHLIGGTFGSIFYYVTLKDKLEDYTLAE